MYFAKKISTAPILFKIIKCNTSLFITNFNIMMANTKSSHHISNFINLSNKIRNTEPNPCHCFIIIISNYININIFYFIHTLFPICFSIKFIYSSRVWFQNFFSIHSIIYKYIVRFQRSNFIFMIIYKFIYFISINKCIPVINRSYLPQIIFNLFYFK